MLKENSTERWWRWRQRQQQRRQRRQQRRSRQKKNKLDKTNSEAHINSCEMKVQFENENQINR